MEAVLQGRRKGGGSKEQCRLLVQCRWNKLKYSRKASGRLEYSSSGKLEYCAERLEDGAGRLEYSTVKVEGWSMVQVKGWSMVQGGWSLYSARKSP